MDPIFAFVVLAAIIVFLGGYVGIVAWAIGDAQKRGYGGSLVVLSFWLLGPLAVLVWVATRPKETVQQQVPSSFDDPEDAIAAAARLDLLGDWESSAALYRSVAERWPKHGTYVANCLSEIQKKQSQR